MLAKPSNRYTKQSDRAGLGTWLSVWLLPVMTLMSWTVSGCPDALGQTPPPEEAAAAEPAAKPVDSQPPDRPSDSFQRWRSLRARRPMEGDGPRRGPRPDGPLSPADREEVRAFVREHFPMLHEHLEGLRGREPELFRRRAERIMAPMRELMETYKADPELGAMLIQERRAEVQLRLLGRMHGKHRNESRQKQMEERIRTLTAEMFDLQHERRGLEIRRMETRLQELRQRHDENARMREKIIARETAKYLDHQEDLSEPTAIEEKLTQPPR